MTAQDATIYSRIAGTGGYLPPKVVTNADLEQRLDTTDEWIYSRTGIRSRRVADDQTGVCDLAEHAARGALDAAGGAAPDLIIVATTTPDKIFPSTACLLQQRLELPECPAFDVQAVCTGFVYALGVADLFVRAGRARRALVVGAEVMSRILDWNDRSTCVLFGDGAGAVVLEPADAPGVYSTQLHADGAYSDLLHTPGGPGAPPGGEAAHLRMAGNEVFRMAVVTFKRLIDETLTANGFAHSDVDWLIPHQANSRIIAATAKKLGLPMDKVVMTVAEHGNTSAASIPLALDCAVRDGRVQRGDLLLLEALGGGLTWGSALVRY